VKLATTLAATFALVVISLTGCATDNDGEGGAYLAGMRPAKPSIDDPTGTGLPQPPVGQTETIQQKGMIHLPDIAEGLYAETIKPWFEVRNLCENCEVTLVTVPTADKTANDGIGEISVVSDGGDQLCKIYLDQNGNLNTTDCSR
jgi:hypothetical protein